MIDLYENDVISITTCASCESGCQKIVPGIAVVEHQSLLRILHKCIYMIGV